MYNEELLHRLMSDYTEQEGARLRKELSSQGTLAPTPGLDKKVRRGLFRLKYRVHVRAAVAVAACLAVALLLPTILQQPGPGTLAPQPQMVAPAPAAPAAGVLPEAEVDFDDLIRARIEPEAFIFYDTDSYVVFGERPDYLPPENEYITPFAAAGFGGELECPIYGYDFVPEVGGYGFVEMPSLSFELPEGFYRVEGFLHNGLYVYRFAHRYYQHTYANFYVQPLLSQYDTPVITSEARPIELGGQTVYYYLSDWHGISIFFERDSIYHELISGFGWETTLLLVEAILAG